MHHTTLAFATLLTIPFLVDSNYVLPTVGSDDCVHYSCIMFKGPTTEVKFKGQMDWKTYEKWFVNSFASSGSRINGPRTAESIGVLVLRDSQNRLLMMMPICAWHKKMSCPTIVCQSESHGKPPAFALATGDKTVPEYLEKMKRELSVLKDTDLYAR